MELVTNPVSLPVILMPNETRSIFSGTRSTSIDNTTQFTISLNPLDPSIYRFTNTGGTAPALRTNRGVALSGITMTLTANINGTLTMSAGSGSPFSGVLVSDILFIPGPSTGDPTDRFNTANEGFWTVLGVTSNTLITLVRQGDFSGMSEIVVPANNAVLVYSAAGVQVGDYVDISSGFSNTVQRSYQVLAVTPGWFEVTSTTPLDNEVATPHAAGMVFYYLFKRYLHIESDQDACVQVNGDSGLAAGRISPLQVGGFGEYEKIGPVWSLTLVNRASVSANVVIISAE